MAVTRLDWTKDIRAAVKRLLDDPAISDYLEHGPDDLALRQTLLADFVRNQLDRRVFKISQKKKREAKEGS